MTTADAYREGLAYGRRIAEHETDPMFSNLTHAQALRIEVRLAGNRRLRRARALGELRGYRNAQP